MKREEIIEAIEKMRTHGVTDAWCAEFTKMMQNKAQRRNSLADDFHRAITYCFILFSGTKFIPKQQRAFLRPTLRAVLLAAGLLIGVILEIIVVAIAFHLMGIGEYTLFFILFGLLFQLGYIVTKGNAMIQGYSGNELGLCQECTRCNYDLSGLDSVLGEKLWVGPELCPECGRCYPAVV